MGNRAFLIPAVGATTFFIILFLFTKIFGPIPFSVNSVVTDRISTFDVTGEGKVSIKPDIANVTVGITSNGPSLKVVQDQVNAIIAKVSEGIKAAGVDAKDIQTTNYNVNPEYDYTNGQKIKGYTASTNLSIKVREIDKVNQVIDISTANGANQVGRISFDVDDKSKAENEARQKAVDQARKKAEDAARIAGLHLGKIINYYESFPGAEPIYRMGAVDAKEGIGGSPTQVEPGSTDITVTVTLSYILR